MSVSIIPVKRFRIYTVDLALYKCLTLTLDRSEMFCCLYALREQSDHILLRIIIAQQIALNKTTTQNNFENF